METLTITYFNYLYEVFKTWEIPFLMNVRREDRSVKKEESIKALV